MRAVLTIFFLFWFSLLAPARAGDRPEFKTKRWQEDWRALCDPARQTEVLDPLKCIPLGVPGLTLTIGGEVRERFDVIRNPFYGLSGIGNDDYWTSRMLLHGDLRYKDSARIFIELGSHLASDRRFGLSPTDRDRLDVQQAFVDLSGKISDDLRLTFRGGRQELSFGSARLVSVRDGANIRRSFDGGSVILKGAGFETTAFAVRPVKLKEDVFDDASDRAVSFWGVYNSIRGLLPKGQTWDIYYLGYLKDSAWFADGREQEKRHSFGTRYAGEVANWDWDTEAVLQTGTFGTADIHAWMVVGEVGYTFREIGGKPRLGLEATAASGDRRRDDGELGTFNPLFPLYPLFTQSGLPAPANLLELHPTVTFYPVPRLRLIAGWAWMWKDEKDDAFYAPVLTPKISTVGLDGYMGQRMHLEAKYVFNDHVELFAKYTHFWASDTLRTVGGRDGDYFGAWIDTKF